MDTDLTIAPMSTADLAIVADWAAAEGWNPGLDDVEAFHRVDPGGFLMGWLGDRPIAAISVVRHSPAYAFLGFYLCHPDHRGQGHGLAIWKAGMARLKGITVGLDGVVAQQDNYRRSGFAFAHQTQRIEGAVTGRRHDGFYVAGPNDLPDMLALDAAVQGVRRDGFVRCWSLPVTTRQTLIRRSADGIDAMGTIRACRTGHKIGPLICPDLDTAIALVESLAALLEASQVILDIPDPNPMGKKLASAFDLSASFAVARMYKGSAPKRKLTRLFGESTFELG